MSILAGIGGSALGSSLIQGATSLLGGLFNRGPKISTQLHAAQLMEERRYKWLVQGAKNAGFNPLTVLGATGGQQAPAPQAPISRSAVIGNAIAKAAEAYDPIRREREQLENELLREQVADIKATRKKVGVEGLRTTSSPTKVYDPQSDNMYTVDPAQTTLPVVDPGNSRPELSRVNRGSMKGRYVIGVNGKYYVTPPGMSPTALNEEILGSVGGELTGLLSTIITSANRVYVNDKGEFVPFKPKGRPKGRTSVTLDSFGPATTGNNYEQPIAP